jgi:hypothetical protein
MEDTTMPTSNTWQNVGSFPGYFHTAATLLADGMRVLVTGGTRNPNSGGGCRQAWIFDGTNCAIAQISGVMTQPRFGHTATTMTNGHVLITGSEALDMTSHPYAITAELFDPSTGQFVPAADMTEPRGWHTATLLPSTGEVLIAGGEDPAAVNTGSSMPKKTAEIYNPQTGTFRKVKGQMAAGHSKHTATLLPNGKVLIAGGNGYCKTAEIYDPATDGFTTVGNLSIGRLNHGAALLPDGRVLVAGGYEYGGVSSPCEEVFNPSTNQFTPVPAIQKTVYGLTLSALPTGKVIAVGGCANNEHWQDLTIDYGYWIFDPNQNPPTFMKAGSCLMRIAFQSAIVLANGVVFVIGGASILGSVSGVCMIFWPDMVTLSLRFHGTGKGSVTCIPGGTLTYQTNYDIPIAAGLLVQLTAIPNAPYLTIGYKQIPATKFSPAHWEKCIISHKNTFDGWGQVAPLNNVNPLEKLMDSNHSADVNFSEYTTSASWRFPLKI